MNEAEYVCLCKLIGNAEDLGRRPIRAIVGKVDEGEGFTVELPQGGHYNLPLMEATGLRYPILISDSPVIEESKPKDSLMQKIADALHKPKVTMEIGDANKGDKVDWDEEKQQFTVNGKPIDQYLSSEWNAIWTDGEENPFDGLDPTWDPSPDA